MKKFISYALVTLLLLSTLAGCASNTNNTTPNTEDTQNGIQTYGPMLGTARLPRHLTAVTAARATHTGSQPPSNWLFLLPR